MIQAFIDHSFDFSAPFFKLETQVRLNLTLKAIFRKNRLEAFKLVRSNPLKDDDEDGFKTLQDRVKLIDPGIELTRGTASGNASFERFYQKYVALFGVPGTQECLDNINKYLNKSNTDGN